MGPTQRHSLRGEAAKAAKAAEAKLWSLCHDASALGRLAKESSGSDYGGASLLISRQRII